MDHTWITLGYASIIHFHWPVCKERTKIIGSLSGVLLLLIITFKWHTQYIKVKFTPIQCHVIGFSILFGVLATIVPLFSTYLIRGMWVVQTMSIMLTMNVACFILIILSFLKDFV